MKNIELFILYWIIVVTCLFIGMLYLGVYSNVDLAKELVSYFPVGQFLCVFLYMGYRVFKKLIKLDPDEEYIKDSYPKIYKKLHPFGDYSVNNIAYWSFSFGRYDDGSDKQLNLIKLKVIYFGLFTLWAFLLLVAGQVLTSGPIWKSLTQ